MGWLTGRVAQIELVPGVLDDHDRFLDHVTGFAVSAVVALIGEIIQAVQISIHSPRIGRPMKGGERKLVIGRDSHGDIVLYRFVPAFDTVFVLAIRSQRDVGYKHP